MDIQKYGETCLVTGIDESEGIVAATFSRNMEDTLPRTYPSKKDDKKRQQLEAWMQEGNRDYRFIEINNRDIRRFQPIPALVTEPLIRSYVDSLRNGRNPTPDNLYLLIDGILSERHRAYLKGSFRRDFKAITIRNIIKRDSDRAVRKKGFKLLGPKAIEMTDILAYELCRGRDYDGRVLSPSQLFNHPKKVIIDEGVLLGMIAEEKARRNKR